MKDSVTCNNKYKPLIIGDLLVKKPVIQGGMGIGISLGNLAGHVAKEGGLGIISAAQIGFKGADFESNTKEANLRAMETELEKARKIAPEGVIGFNIMVAMRHYEDYVRKAVEIGADIIVSGAGLPTDLPKLVEGSSTKIAPIVSTEKSAKVILRYWDKKYHRIPDLLVIEGPKAGGHLGFDKEQITQFSGKAGAVSYEEEVRGILDVVKEYENKCGAKIPVALAGGIYNEEDVLRAFGLGVNAVQVASRFVTTVECDADIRFKESYLKAEEKDIVIVKSPVGMPGRAILNPFMEKIKAGERVAPKKCLGCLRNCNPSEIPYCITQALINAAKGNVDDALLFCGARIWQTKKIETVKEVIDSLLGSCV